MRSQVASESVAARAIEDQIKTKRERLVELRSRQTGDLQPPALTRDQLEVIFDYYANFGRSGVMTPQKSMDSFMWVPCPEPCAAAVLLSVLSLVHVLVASPDHAYLSLCVFVFARFMKFCRECPDLVEGCVP